MSDDDADDDEEAPPAKSAKKGPELPMASSATASTKAVEPKRKRVQSGPVKQKKMTQPECQALAYAVALLTKGRSHSGLAAKLESQTRKDVLENLVDPSPDSLTGMLQLVELMEKDTAVFAKAQMNLTFLKDPNKVSMHSDNAKRLRSRLEGNDTYQSFATCVSCANEAVKWLKDADRCDAVWLAFDKVLVQLQEQTAQTKKREKLGCDAPKPPSSRAAAKAATLTAAAEAAPRLTSSEQEAMALTQAECAPTKMPFAGEPCAPILKLTSLVCLSLVYRKFLIRCFGCVPAAEAKTLLCAQLKKSLKEGEIQVEAFTNGNEAWYALLREATSQFPEEQCELDLMDPPGRLKLASHIPVGEPPASGAQEPISGTARRNAAAAATAVLLAQGMDEDVDEDMDEDEDEELGSELGGGGGEDASEEEEVPKKPPIGEEVEADEQMEVAHEAEPLASPTELAEAAVAAAEAELEAGQQLLKQLESQASEANQDKQQKWVIKHEFESKLEQITRDYDSARDMATSRAKQVDEQKRKLGNLAAAVKTAREQAAKAAKAAKPASDAVKAGVASPAAGPAKPPLISPSTSVTTKFCAMKGADCAKMALWCRFCPTCGAPQQ